MILVKQIVQRVYCATCGWEHFYTMRELEAGEVPSECPACKRVQRTDAKG